MRVTNQDVADRLRQRGFGGLQADNLSINDVQFAYDQLRDEAGNPQRVYDGPRGGGFARGISEARVDAIIDLLTTN